MRIWSVFLGLLLSLLTTAVALVTPADAEARRVIIVSLDGARPDGILQAETPTITRLWKQGAYTFRAQTVFPSVTLPAHASMLTGLSPNRHWVRHNHWKPGEPTVAVETVFSLAKVHGLKTAMVVTKEKFGLLARPGSLDHFEVVQAPAPEVAHRTRAYLIPERPHLLFLHLADADLTGHRYGWMSPEYLQVLKTIDQGIAVLVRALEETGLLRETLLILTADHGGHGYTHGTTMPEDMTIPWIAVGPGVRAGYEISDQVTIYDTAATVLHFLGIPIPANWNGRPLSTIFRP